MSNTMQDLKIKAIKQTQTDHNLEKENPGKKTGTKDINITKTI